MSEKAVLVHEDSPSAFFKSGFSDIARTRMANLPICRTDIAVETLGFTRFGDHWIGVVVTPWSILAVLACGKKDTWKTIPVGAIRSVSLPAGDFSFLGMNDPILGEYQACSLMSPLEGVADQETANAIALTSLRLMLSDTPEPPEEKGTPIKKVIPIHAKKEDDPLKEEPAADLKRRDFFTRYWK